MNNKEMLSKLLQESILQLCRVSVGFDGSFDVDGIICICSEREEQQIVVKVHEKVGSTLPLMSSPQKSSNHGDTAIDSRAPRSVDNVLLNRSDSEHDSNPETEANPDRSFRHNRKRGGDSPTDSLNDYIVSESRDHNVISSDFTASQFTSNDTKSFTDCSTIESSPKRIKTEPTDLVLQERSADVMTHSQRYTCGTCNLKRMFGSTTSLCAHFVSCHQQAEVKYCCMACRIAYVNWPEFCHHNATEHNTRTNSLSGAAVAYHHDQRTYTEHQNDVSVDMTSSQDPDQAIGQIASGSDHLIKTNSIAKQSEFRSAERSSSYSHLDVSMDTASSQVESSACTETISYEGGSEALTTSEASGLLPGRAEQGDSALTPDMTDSSGQGGGEYTARTTVCYICREEFVTFELLEEHCLKEHKRYPCSICWKTFTEKHTRLRHHVVHTGVRLYVCYTCGKSYKRKDHLTAHKQCHGAETLPYSSGNYSSTNSRWLSQAQPPTTDTTDVATTNLNQSNSELFSRNVVPTFSYASDLLGSYAANMHGRSDGLLSEDNLSRATDTAIKNEPIDISDDDNDHIKDSSS